MGEKDDVMELHEERVAGWLEEIAEHVSAIRRSIEPVKEMEAPSSDPFPGPPENSCPSVWEVLPCPHLWGALRDVMLLIPREALKDLEQRRQAEVARFAEAGLTSEGDKPRALSLAVKAMANVAQGVGADRPVDGPIPLRAVMLALEHLICMLAQYRGNWREPAPPMGGPDISGPKPWSEAGGEE
jgi:hypothetical protein